MCFDNLVVFHRHASMAERTRHTAVCKRIRPTYLQHKHTRHPHSIVFSLRFISPDNARCNFGFHRLIEKCHWKYIKPKELICRISIPKFKRHARNKSSTFFASLGFPVTKWCVNYEREKGLIRVCMGTSSVISCESNCCFHRDH